ncbi:Leukocyte receptor tyrosine protein kinase, partial [Daphnia magna]
MTRQRQSWQQLMVVVTAGMTLTLMLTTSVFPCDGAAPPAGPSSSAAGVHDAAGLYCDFEDQQCRWQWSRFVRRSATEINATIYTAPDPAMISGPLDDADGRPT